MFKTIYSLDLWPSDNTPCVTKTKIRVQLVFVLDRTGSFSDFLGDFPKISNQIVSNIIQKYPGSEFGIVHFGDYPTDTFPTARIDATKYIPFLKL